MEEENSKIITTTKAEKVKDPRRVELGKRLGAISKEARERKAMERQQQQRRESLMSSCLVFGLPTVIGIAAAAAVGYYHFKNNATVEVTKEEQKEEQLSNKIPKLERL